MKKSLVIVLIVLVTVSCNKRSGKPRVLVFTKTAGYHHESIPAGVKAIIELGKENNFDVDTTSSADRFQEDSLKKYSAVVFLNTTGTLLNSYQEADFERYIQSGGGYVGVHAAADAEYGWSWYGRLAGAYFSSHPEQQEATLKVADAADNSTKHLPAEWKRKDEWYNYKKLNDDVHVLLTIDEMSYHGGTQGDRHPIAWSHEYDGGRAWYTGLGHTAESYQDPNYLKHLLGGILYAVGDNKNLNYGNAKTPHVLAEERFTKTPLTMGEFFEPVEMSILPNLDILVAQRRGEIFLYKNDTKTTKQAGFLDVYWKTQHTPGVNAEEGLLGIKADPDFATNHFVYVYYSPSDTSVNRLSRFTFSNDSIDRKSEKIVLQLYSQREICCHTGGSIAFGKDHELFVSTGDNSTPFDEANTPYASHGFGPQDDRPGHTQYDARRGPSNTNDLRGKILRIKIKPDGSYEIPEGNLFPVGTDKTRPEIYVMGDRNPYRITVDKKTGYLYWGEVGPDANQDSLETRGPRGYDEFNQARKAGYFGWPLFVGNNYPYHPHDYNTNVNGAPYDPARPVNLSKNNTGLKELPPVQPAFIWYPYAESPDFPQLGSGGRCAMGGPVFRSEDYPKETRLPDDFDGKLFIYDFTRTWFKVVTMKPNGDFENIQPFMEHTKFNSPIDAELGPDGKLYILEYGNGWFKKNPDGGIFRIDFNPGNVAPKISSLDVNKTSGLLPLQVSVSLTAKDVENEPLTYRWDLGDGTKQETKVPALNYTYNKPGEFVLSVEVVDGQQASTLSEKVTIYAGNEIPKVAIAVKGNKSFYFPGHSIDYNVSVDDKADGGKGIDPANLIVWADYESGSDKVNIPQGHQRLSAAAEGKNIMLTLDCATCHKENEKSIGPAFIDVAKRYKDDPKVVSYLVQKIAQGGSGKWGETNMPAHPALKEDDTKLIIAWIQSLTGENKEIKSLPAKGTVDATLHKPVQSDAQLTISASYTNKGNTTIRPLTGSDAVSLRNSELTFRRPRNISSRPVHQNADLTGIVRVELGLVWTHPPSAAETIELRLDSEQGRKVAGFTVSAGAKLVADAEKKTYSLDVKSLLDGMDDGKRHDVFVVITTPKEPTHEQPLMTRLSFFQQ
jgi:cytochrome c